MVESRHAAWLCAAHVRHGWCRQLPCAAETPQFLEAAVELAGPYLWGRYDLLLLPPSFPYGGRSAGCTLCQRHARGVVALPCRVASPLHQQARRPGLCCIIESAACPPPPLL